MSEDDVVVVEESTDWGSGMRRIVGGGTEAEDLGVRRWRQVEGEGVVTTSKGKINICVVVVSGEEGYLN